ncbi:predicted protein [Sclerotinia sclerotiorum 1980 UF-70]|uniref:Uncharacterized protein n=1 Tax=Sclerotinia sclerotiorum (strain ATCC 18683 / 1980 / Ss-1) TaxID=665079 RepID=A7F967_SCLS1|nr:predicted protein [Sclerotinia sclerotiorum 1980 UF-70]EDO00278.1 predicted protein [Sclerotinia sclerotiorum 1980 UF-70]
MTSKWYKLGTLELVEKILKAARKLYSRQIPTEQTQLQLLPWPISTNTAAITAIILENEAESIPPPPGPASSRTTMKVVLFLATPIKDG